MLVGLFRSGKRILQWGSNTLCACDVSQSATDSTQVSSGVGGKRTVFKSGDDLEDDFQEDGKADTSDGSDGEVDDEPGNTANAPKTLKSNTKDTLRTLPSGKLNSGKSNPKVVKF